MSSDSHISPFINLNLSCPVSLRRSIFSCLPVDKLSKPITLLPLFNSRDIKLNPMNPAEPVINQVLLIL